MPQIQFNCKIVSYEHHRRAEIPAPPRNLTEGARHPRAGRDHGAHPGHDPDRGGLRRRRHLRPQPGPGA